MNVLRSDILYAYYKFTIKKMLTYYFDVLQIYTYKNILNYNKFLFRMNKVINIIFYCYNKKVNCTILKKILYIDLIYF